MRKRTLKDTLLKKDAHISLEQYRIYLVRAVETVLYIGQSENTYNRLLSHLGQNQAATPDQLGECIRANVASSARWMFEEYTLEDCREITLKRRQVIYGARDEDIPLDVDEVEEAMIKYYRPPLNTASNPNPNPFPKIYEWRDGLDGNNYMIPLTNLLGLDKIVKKLKSSQ